MGEAKTSKVEAVKRGSHGLRGTIARTLDDGAAASFGETDAQLLKFHGLYQQDDRDARRERRRPGGERAFSFMVRSKVPGGVLDARQYLVHDELADRFGDGTLRITTRQDFQFHGVIKDGLRPTLYALNEALVTTFGACGDVVRNVMCCPVPGPHPVRDEVERAAAELTRRFLPATGAYHEIWLDGEKLPDPAAREAASAEPIYGAGYLPRKFKIAIAHPGDNCVDVWTQDVGIIALADPSGLAGFNVLVGGGLGMTHTKPGTFPRLADPLARVEPGELVEVVEQIVLVQRDHGDRGDRRHARLKYLIHDRGIDWFREEVERRLGRALAPPLAVSPMALELHLGWHEQTDGRSFRGLYVENGRLRDDGARRQKSAVRAIVERFGCGVRLTPHQDLLLTGIPAAARGEVEAILRAHGAAEADSHASARLHSMACPALPTCGLALADAERALPSVMDELEVELGRLGLEDEPFTVRMTGCPNGCARPYVADLAFVGRSLDRYVVLLGGGADGTRLNEAYADLVPRDELARTVTPLLELFRETREPGERFGAFCRRLGMRVLRAYASAAGRPAGRGDGAHGAGGMTAHG